MFERAVGATVFLKALIGKEATNIIVSYSGSLPPFIEPLTSLEQNRVIERTKIGCKPEYEDIRTIDCKIYAVLSEMPESVLTTENF